MVDSLGWRLEAHPFLILFVFLLLVRVSISLSLCSSLPNDLNLCIGHLASPNTFWLYYYWPPTAHAFFALGLGHLQPLLIHLGFRLMRLSCTPHQSLLACPCP
uniref:GPI mannosyltransferase 2 n=1 Tax=Aegilops tauschii subsp. strangulata TaxID=200361 RepID=A0A453ST09_AEGTS